MRYFFDDRETSQVSSILRPVSRTDKVTKEKPSRSLYLSNWVEPNFILSIDANFHTIHR